MALAVQNPSVAAEMAASNKTAKYAGLTSDYHFQPIAVESLGPENESAIHFLTALGQKIAQQTGDKRETVFFCFSVCLSWCSASIACYSTILLSVMTARIKCHCLHFQLLIFLFPNPSGSLIPRV